MDQLRDVSLDDVELMREIVTALIDDTARQLEPLAAAIRGQNQPETVRLAHYSKGACANVGAKPAAEFLREIEHTAREGNFAACTQSLASLSDEVERLRTAVTAL
jgi:HPt (histidine-containing phosphotransfer) domain-containing protein